MLETPLDQLIKRLSRLPGLGPRSARRTALFLVKTGPDDVAPCRRNGSLAEMFAPVWNVVIWICRINVACVWTGGAIRAVYACGRDVPDLWAIERREFFPACIMFWEAP